MLRVLLPAFSRIEEQMHLRLLVTFVLSMGNVQFEKAWKESVSGISQSSQSLSLA